MTAATIANPTACWRPYRSATVSYQLARELGEKNLMNISASGPVGILGAGRLGQAMARTAQRAGRSVVIANSRGPESLASVVSTLGEGVAL